MKYAVKLIPMTEGQTKTFLLENRTLAMVDHPNIGKYHNTWMESGIPEVLKDFVHDMMAGDLVGEDSADSVGKDSEKLVDEESGIADEEDSEDVEDIHPGNPPSRTLFISMKSYTSSLYNQIQDEPPLSRVSISRIFNGLVAALAHLKSLKIVHGDVKPDNILLDEALNPKLIDFGSAFTVGESYRRGGTDGYAPESETATFATDIYGFAVSMLEVICSIKTVHDREKVLGDIKMEINLPRRLVEADVDYAIKNIVIRILKAASPNDRPVISEIAQECSITV